MIILLLLFAQLIQANCLKVTPYQSFGPVRMGDEVPKGFKFEKTDPDGGLAWAKGGGFRVETNEHGKIDWIQRTLAKNECAEIEGRKFTRSSTPAELRKAFPKCTYEDQRLGSDLLQCNGFFALWDCSRRSCALRIDVSKQDIESLKAEHAASAARYHIEKDSHGYPIPRR